MSPPDVPVVAYRVCYSGRVQGVGFRATAVEMAQRFSVTGWVRNLSDGRVELLVEGGQVEVQRFLDALRDYWRDNIHAMQAEPQPVSGRFECFDFRW